MDPVELQAIEKMIEDVGVSLKKINNQIIQAKYNYSAKGAAKVKRNNERRRLKTYYKKVLKELIKVTLNATL